MYFKFFFLLAITLGTCTSTSNTNTVETTEPILMNETPTTLYVIAPSGLSLRASSDPKSKKYDTVPFGEPVDILEEPEEPITISGQTGKMVKVDYLQTEGYMFNAFLSQKKPEQHLFSWTSEAQNEDIRFYYASDDEIVGNGNGEAQSDGIYWYYAFSGKRKEGSTFLVKVKNESAEEGEIDPVEEEWTIEGKKLTKNKTKKIFEKK